MALNSFKDLTGKRFGRLTVLERAHNDRYDNIYWSCQCDCGTAKVIRGCSLKEGSIKSCGCYHRECAAMIGGRKRVHGHTANAKGSTPEYNAWMAMKHRCYNPNYEYYQNYGGRGIEVCQEWLDSFPAFYDHVGDRPVGKHSIDRIDNDGNYEPGNVKWSTAKEQANNRRERRDSRRKESTTT